jgi:hypothetical protein
MVDILDGQDWSSNDWLLCWSMVDIMDGQDWSFVYLLLCWSMVDIMDGQDWASSIDNSNKAYWTGRMNRYNKERNWCSGWARVDKVAASRKSTKWPRPDCRLKSILLVTWLKVDKVAAARLSTHIYSISLIT